MRILKSLFRGISIEVPPFIANRNLASRILLPVLSVLSLVLTVVFFMAGRNVEKILDSAITRNAQLRAQAMSFALEHMLVETRNHLLVMGAGALEKEKMLRALHLRARSDGLKYREVAFIGLDPDDGYLLINNANEFVSVPLGMARDAAGPFHNINSSQSPGYVNIGRPLEVSYQLTNANNTLQSVIFHILRFSTAIYDESGQFRGILSLALDMGALREKLSLAGAFNQPVRDGAEGSAQRSFFFDQDGWMMFQSEDVENLGKPLNSDIVRAGFRGDYGRQGFSPAFRPAPEHLNYWTMISDIQEQRAGMISLSPASSAFASGGAQARASYAPVTFKPGGDDAPQVVGGIAMLDEGVSATSPGQRMLGIFVTAFLICIASLGLCLWWVAHGLGRRLNMFIEQLRERNVGDSSDSLCLPALPGELDRLRDEVNTLLLRLRDARDFRMNNEAARNRHRQRQPVLTLPQIAQKHASFFVGESHSMRLLYSQIEKAAQVDADVLVRGETGTGKELVAASIHSLSRRMNGPFMSINCGALDEALLMDTLFGHVRGAFTEARGSRKGAFLAANGGTLLLDEIGNAPAKVQQALLRALSTRHIRPLGSDEEIAFDTRIIAATNSQLHGSGGDFRNDLYYRLAVITIDTPPLRQRMDDIPHLIVHFLAQSAGDKTSSGGIPGVSHGALEKLQAHDWPGNVRELKNVMTRAMAFCNGKLIMAEDLRIITASGPMGESFSVNDSSDALLTANDAQPSPEITLPHAILDKLNQRQLRVWPLLVSNGSISRQEYQALAGENISSRTAQYDLKFLVSLGILRREGRGPGQRYWPVEPVCRHTAAEPA